ncbi:hypothetical protein EV175_005500 [Coemansia sp. RSA 1933]|nr:hypothetical protein EV175_005500 [Coemansia sp. RSA 1933]
MGTLNSSVSLHPGTDIQNMPSPFSNRGAKERRSSESRVRRHGQQKPKWLKSELDEYMDPTQVSREEIYLKVCEKEDTPQVFRPLKIGGWTTDGITSALQEPSVSQAELEEYEKYVHQFDDLSKWIVPSSDMLYSDYVNRKQDTYPDTTSPTVSKRQTSIATGSLSINTALDLDYLLHGDAERRLNTPVPRRTSQMTQASLSATTSRSYSHRLFVMMPPNSNSSGDSSGSRQQQQYSRNRSNTSSNERGSLWGLWSQNSTSGSSGSGHMLGNRPFAHQIPTRDVLDSRNQIDYLRSQSPGLYRMRQHDRSRSLDLGNLNVSHSSIAAIGALGPNKDTLVPEPRVTAADLKIYENFARMSQAFKT